MKKIIAGAVCAVLVAAWAVRYCIVNDGFAFHYQYPTTFYGMHETVEIGDNMQYTMHYAPGYSISVEAARIVDVDSYLEEFGTTADQYSNLSEKYLELTLNIANNGDNEEGLIYYGIPVQGKNWYVFYDGEITASLNDFYGENDVTDAAGCIVTKGSSATVKVAYNLRPAWFLSDQWDNIEDEDMWLWVTMKPYNQKIKIEL